MAAFQNEKVEWMTRERAAAFRRTQRGLRVAGLVLAAAGGWGLVLGTAHADQAQTADAKPATGASFVENFDRFNSGRWNISNGWSNGNHQSCRWRKQNVDFKNGELRFKIDVEPAPRPGQEKTIHDRDFNCAEIQTHQLYGFGYYETAFRSAPASGTVSAIFTYIGPGLDPAKPHDEIDFEVLGKNTNEVQLNFYSDGKALGGKLVPFGYDNSKKMAHMAFEWRRDVIRWYIDGKLVHEVKDTPERPLPTEPSKIMLSLWSGQGRDIVNWLGPFAPTTLPLEAAYDYVAFTKLGDPCQFETSIVCQLEGKAGK